MYFIITISTMNIYDLINYPESDWLDFKLEWHGNTANLILDILCLANSDANNDRYIVFGVNDKDRSSIATPVTNRKTLDQLNDLLGKANFNRIPTINLETVNVNGVDIDILIIKKTKYRPYFLTQDYMGSKTLVRAGVVYTRNGSVNTPKDSCANENQVADMWRERFGLTLMPMDRLEIYIKDTKNWVRFSNPFIEDNVFSFYYAPFPEFTIDFKCVGFADYAKSAQGIMHSDMVWGNTIGASADSVYVIKYLSTILKDGHYTIMDNHRNYLIDPDSRFFWYSSHKPITEVHVETERSFITDTGISAECGLGRINNDATYCNRATFCYHVEGSLKYYLQKLLDKTVYESCIFFPKTKEEITSKIYLIPEDAKITEFIRSEAIRILKLETDPNPPLDA